MAVRAGRHRVGRDDGTLQVRTYREGLAQKVGHDLIIDVGQSSPTDPPSIDLDGFEEDLAWINPAAVRPAHLS